MKKLFSLCFALCFALSVSAQVQSPLQSPLQSPQEFLGYPLGSTFTYHHKVVDYFKYVDEASEKVQTFQYGETYERRPLMIAVVSSEENMKRLEQYRKNNLISAGLIEGEIEGENLPIVWLSYNIHGNEAVGTETAMKVLHTLVNGDFEGVEEWLKEAIVVIDPCENPDGRDRYTNWYNRTQSKKLDPNPDTWEHNEPWPGGRVNHYMIDLNRDWAWQTQTESRQRIRIYQNWMPHVHVDVHEMGRNSPYFFGPSAKPFHEVITPWQRDFHNKSGDNHAKYFDEKGWLYFTKETFDLFYPSYGDTWPTYNGAIGFTYEQGGSGSAGIGVITQTKDTLTLNDRIDHQYYASLSSIEVSWKNKEKMLDEFASYFSDGVNNPQGEYKSYVIKNNNSAKRVKAMLELLDRQNIQYSYLGSGGRAIRGFNYLENQETSFQPEAEDILVSAYQPHARMVKVLFEPKSNYEDSLTYDLTAWAIPYIYELEAYAVKERLNSTDEKEIEFGFTPLEITDTPAYAYYSPWSDFTDAKFLAAITQRGVKARYAMHPFETEGKQFERGTVIITQADNRKLPNFHKIVIEEANRLKQEITPATTGLVQRGKDLGSNNVVFIEMPKVALIAGDGIYTNAFGELWHFFEQQLEYPVSVINSSDFNRTDLSAFNTLILGAGSYGNMASSIKSFVKEGGKVIALEQAIRLFANDSQTSLGEKTKTYRDKLEKEDKEEGDKLLKKYGEARRNRLSERVEGSIYKIHLDETHPLGFGDDDEIHIMKRNSTTYPYLSSGWNVGTFQEDSHVSGFVGYKLKEEIQNTLAIGVERFGRGKVIYMTDSPVFRGFWHSGKLLLANAIFFEN